MTREELFESVLNDLISWDEGAFIHIDDIVLDARHAVLGEPERIKLRSISLTAEQKKALSIGNKKLRTG